MRVLRGGCLSSDLMMQFVVKMKLALSSGVLKLKVNTHKVKLKLAGERFQSDIHLLSCRIKEKHFRTN